MLIVLHVNNYMYVSVCNIDVNMYEIRDRSLGRNTHKLILGKGRTCSIVKAV